MGFFNDLGKKTSETTTRIARETKLKMKMSENKGKIEDLYSEIGKKMYQKHLKEEVIYGDLTEDFSTIDTLAKEIESAKVEILKLNQKKVCLKCNEEIPISAQFCPKCGDKQIASESTVTTPEVVPEPSEAEQEPIAENNVETTNPESQENNTENNNQ